MIQNSSAVRTAFVPNGTTAEEPAKLKRASKLAVVCYGLGDLASQFVWTYVGTYLSVFYSDVVGLAPAAISAIMLFARILDVVTDPFEGIIAERTRSRFGRFRPYVLFGAPLLALFSVLTFTAPFSGTSTEGIIWATVSYAIAGTFYSMVNLSYGALSAVMTEDSVQRDRINTSRVIGMNVGMLIVNACSAGLALSFSGEGATVANQHGYFMVSIIYACIALPLFLITVFTAREVVEPPVHQEETKISDSIKALVTNKPLLALTISSVIMSISLFGRYAVMAYYAIYCLGSYDLIALVATMPTVVSILAAPLIPVLTRRLGKRNTLILCGLLNSLGLVVVWLSPYDNLAMITFGLAINGAASTSMPLILGMTADCVDYKDLETHVRTDGVAYSTFSLSTKFGQAIGASLGVLIIAAFGYVPNAVQTAGALAGINLTSNLLPALFNIPGVLILFFGYKLTEPRMESIRAQLKERNEHERLELEARVAQVHDPTSEVPEASEPPVASA